MNTITRDELLEQIHNVIVLEALPETYYKQGHIPGARLFPMDQARSLAPTVSPTRAAPIVVYCASETCKNSHEVAKLLGDVGYTNVRVYVGGKADWASATAPREVGCLTRKTADLSAFSRRCLTLCARAAIK